jgi:Omp85 superfamily domain
MRPNPTSGNKGRATGSLFALVLALTPAGLDSLAAQDSISVVADPEIGNGRLRRLFLGDHYRDLWLTPFRVPHLDLGRYAGGLTPLRRGGGLQTKSLRFKGGDGKEYTFRLLQKDPSKFLPVELQESFAADIVKDQMSAMHPGAATVVPPILDAAGVLHVTPRFYVMPDDARLGEFRAEFGNQVGMLEERPTEADDDAPGFAGARKIVDTPELIEDLWKEPWVKVDGRAYLTARLVDLYLGDWDRHEDQWRWALVGEDGNERYLPIPRDRDQALVRYDGFLLWIARQTDPQLLVFNEDYAKPVAATWNGRNLDRRLLVELGRPVWDSIAREIQQVLTDEVIDTAVNRLPAEYLARNGEWLRETLLRRRDGLPRAATRTYEFLADKVRLQAGDKADHAVIERAADGATDVKLLRAKGKVYFHRVFDPKETSEIQIDLRDGDDQLVIRGEGKGPLLRVMGGSGADTLIDSSRARNARFYDVGNATVSVGHGVDHRRYVQPADTSASALPERDWGYRILGTPAVTASSDLGVTLGYRWTRRGFGFRRQPYSSSLQLTGEWSFGRSSGRALLDSRWKLVNRNTYVLLEGLASGIENLNFYGFGNGTTSTEEKEFYRVHTQVLELSPGIGWNIEGKSRFRVMVRARHTRTDKDDENNQRGPIFELQPLGYGNFGQLGLNTQYEWDSRDLPMLPTKGVRLLLDAAYYPVTWSASEGAFGTLDAVGSTFLSPGDQTWLTFAARAGGRHTFGDVPYFEAAYLGGNRSLRGYPRNRFAGESSIFGNLEARMRLFRTSIFVPGELGVFGLVDGGRVFSDGDPDKSWHTDAGGGVFYGAVRRSVVLALGLAQGDEGARFYFGLGLGY